MGANVHQMATADLEAELERIEDSTDYALVKRAAAIERELDAREDWGSDDDRIRESVGNYR